MLWKMVCAFFNISARAPVVGVCRCSANDRKRAAASAGTLVDDLIIQQHRMLECLEVCHTLQA